MGNWRLDSNKIVRDTHDLPDALGRSVEMSGRMVSAVVFYGDAHPKAHVLFPYYHIHPGLGGLLDTAFEPKVSVELSSGQTIKLDHVAEISFDGVLSAKFENTGPLGAEATVFPSTLKPAVFCVYSFRNLSTSRMSGRISIDGAQDQDVETVEGNVTISERLLMRNSLSNRIDFEIEPGTSFEFADVFALSTGEPNAFDIHAELQSRRNLIEFAASRAEFASEHEDLDFVCRLAKLRTIESVFDTTIGPTHSPGGGGGWYGSIWCNDQAEYAFPVFPYLGTLADVAIFDYELLASKMDENGRIPYSIELAGTWLGSVDRGDAAMYAYGASLFLLGLGERAAVEKLLPHIERLIDYCFSQMDERGIVRSESDELEGRYPSGDACLSTSSLLYAGLRQTAMLETIVNNDLLAKEYAASAEKLLYAIETHFGAKVEGYETYQYYEGNDKLRGWICYPLAMGIFDRAEATRNAILSDKLWSEYGLRVISDDATVWDRETAYAILALFRAGFAEDAANKLLEISRRRTSGESVPYLTETSPSFNQLSAESALLVRTITEGLFGMEPQFDRVIIRPKLPESWQFAKIRNVRLIGCDLSVELKRDADRVNVRCVLDGNTEFDGPLPPSGEIVVAKKS